MFSGEVVRWWEAEGAAIDAFWESLDEYVDLADGLIEDEILMAHALYCAWRGWD